MARAKPAIPKIRNLEEADDMLAKIAAGQRDLTLIEATMNEAIDQAKKAANAEAAPLKIKIKALGESLGAYATYHKSELFKRQKSQNLVHGLFGFRKTTALKPLPKLRWGDVLDKLKSLGKPQAIRVKEDINKEVMREWNAADLEAAGARLVQSDEFWYEIKSEAFDDAT